MPPKRKDPEDTAASSKRFRSSINESIEELICPITHELPVEPVLAEDGKVYERSAIETWLQKNQRSPSTNEAIGNRLTPATQIKNIIEFMVKSEALPDDKVNAWKKRVAEQEAVAELRTKAEAGDAQAAYQLGKWLEFGRNNLCKDYAKAFAMYLLSSKGGNAEAMGGLANFYYYGWGVQRNDALALRWAAAGVALNNGRAMMTLGDMYVHGLAGLPKDQEEGFKLLLRGAELGNANSKGMYQVAQMFAKGNGTSVDKNQAEYWMRKAVAYNAPNDFVQKAKAWLSY